MFQIVEGTTCDGKKPKPCQRTGSHDFEGLKMSTLNIAQCPIKLGEPDVPASFHPIIEKYEAAILMIVGFVGFSVIVGLIYSAVRRRVFHDLNNLDVVFDAGGRVSLSLTAVTVTSQLLWPSDFLQIPTIASKIGVGGALWITLCIVLSVLVFPVLGIKLKTRAPGAKTFPQIAYVRFGKPTHILFCVVALATNLIIITNLIMAGQAAVEVITKDTNTEFVAIILTVLFGSYCIIGGLGTTFYISYFNTALVFICSTLFILKTNFFADPDLRNVTSTESIYEAVSCLEGPKGNYEGSYLTFRSESGLVYCIAYLFMTVAIVFCDQANWQSRIAAKPKEGVIGFIIAAFLWFAIPTSFSFVMSLTYKSMSFRNGNGTNLLSYEQIDSGYISPYVIQTLMGREGCYLLLTMLTMALMSTGSGEIMSVCSILVYDVIKTYIRPFRPKMQPTECVLCGRDKVIIPGKACACVCPSVIDCEQCADDILRGRHRTKYDPPIVYNCEIHGKYRHYEDRLLGYKNWCMVAVILAHVPYGLAVMETDMNLNWTYMAAGVLISPFLFPLYCTIGWARVKSQGIIAGGLIGLVCAICGMLAYATSYEGGLSDFYTNTAKEFSILCGLCSGFVVSASITVCVSLYIGVTEKKFNESTEGPVAGEMYTIINQYVDDWSCHATEHGATTVAGESEDHLKNKDAKSFDNADHHCDSASTARQTNHKVYPVTGASIGEGGDMDIEWCKTMTIDNPLNPVRSVYKDELDEIGAENQVTPAYMEAIFRRSKIVSYVAAGSSLVLFLIVVPAVALTQEVLTSEQLTTWISVCQYWCIIGTFFVVFVPPIEEGLQIWRQHQENKRKKEEPTVVAGNA